MLRRITPPMKDGFPRPVSGESSGSGSGSTKEVEIYISPPPTYPPITTEESDCTFQMFVDFSSSWNDCEYGRIVDEWAFLSELSDSDSGF